MHCKSITHNKFVSFEKSIKFSTKLVLRQICTAGKHTQYQCTKQGRKGEQICQKQACFIPHHWSAAQTYATLPHVLLQCSRLAGAGDGVSLLSGFSKKLGPTSPARQPHADRSCPNPLPSHFLTKLPLFQAFLPQPHPQLIFSLELCAMPS